MYLEEKNSILEQAFSLSFSPLSTVKLNSLYLKLNWQNAWEYVYFAWFNFLISRQSWICQNDVLRNCIEENSKLRVSKTWIFKPSLLLCNSEQVSQPFKPTFPSEKWRRVTNSRVTRTLRGGNVGSTWCNSYMVLVYYLLTSTWWTICSQIVAIYIIYILRIITNWTMFHSKHKFCQWNQIMW